MKIKEIAAGVACPLCREYTGEKHHVPITNNSLDPDDYMVLDDKPCKVCQDMIDKDLVLLMETEDKDDDVAGVGKRLDEIYPSGDGAWVPRKIASRLFPKWAESDEAKQNKYPLIIVETGTIGNLATLQRIVSSWKNTQNMLESEALVKDAEANELDISTLEPSPTIH